MRVSAFLMASVSMIFSVVALELVESR